MKALEILEKELHNELYYVALHSIKETSRVQILKEAIKELEETKKEDIYILNKIEESLSMGNKAQSLATVEVYQILKNRNKDKNENNNI